jgi:osmotically-inducible protein OsmY
MKRLLRSGLLLAAAGALAFGAEHEMTMTGCLESSGDGYALAASGGRTQLTGAADFAKHQGHTVKVSGEHTGTMMTVSKLEHVSPECDPSKMTEAGKAAAGERDSDRARTAVAGGPTADDQGGSKADRETTARIRKAIVEDDSLSVAAHNVKIITRDGKVTLRGEVQSSQEKAAVAAIAEGSLGAAVDNQLTVRPEK